MNNGEPNETPRVVLAQYMTNGMIAFRASFFGGPLTIAGFFGGLRHVLAGTVALWSGVLFGVIIGFFGRWRRDRAVRYVMLGHGLAICALLVGGTLVARTAHPVVLVPYGVAGSMGITAGGLGIRRWLRASTAPASLLDTEKGPT
jgi:hypothetical protein